MVSRTRFFRPFASAPPEIDIQKLVYDVVRERAAAMFGPGGSFAVVMRTGNETDVLFTETVVDTLAWDVSLHAETPNRASAKLTA